MNAVQPLKCVTLVSRLFHRGSSTSSKRHTVRRPNPWSQLYTTRPFWALPVQVIEVKNSYWLEVEGLKMCLAHLTDRGVSSSLCWPIVTRLCRNLNGSSWRGRGSLCITNVPAWVTNETLCDLHPYTPEEESRCPWLHTDSAAFESLQKVALDKQLLQQLERMTEGFHTGELKGVHALYNKYATKQKSYSYKSLRACLHLAALDHNTNAERQKAKTKAGEARSQV